MISDRVENLSRYAIPHVSGIQAFLKAHDALHLPLGETAIKGRDLFVRTSEYATKPAEEGRFETHRAYADVQVVVKGAEIMETAPADSLLPLTDYDPAGDYQFFKVEKNISRALVRAGECMVFFPGEAHRPCCSPEGGVQAVKKLVFKVRIK